MSVLAVITWVVVLAVLTSIGAPIAALVFERFPRGGAAFALPVTLLIWTTVVFLIGQVTFGWHVVWVGLLVVGVLSAGAFRRGGVPDWRAVASGYGVFLVAFLLYVLYAGHNIAITPRGGEQFLHYGLTNALVDATTLPPEDFWFAGESLRYYYGSQLQVAMVSILTGTPVRYGYALGLAMFYAILFVSAYGLGGALAATRDRSYRLGGLLGALFVAVGGTLTTTVRLVVGRLPEGLQSEYGRVAFEGLIEERGMSFEEALASQGTVDEWTWFYTRYVIEGALHEFPLYSFVKADLHGHTLSTGYVVVAAAIAFSYYLTPADQRRRRLGLLYGALGVVAGVFGFMNTWSVPTAVGLAWLALAAADAHPGTLLGERVRQWAVPRPSAPGTSGWALAEAWRVVLAGVFAIPVGILGLAISSPFLVFGSVPTNEGVGLLPPRTALGPFLVLYGGILALVLAYVVAAGSRVETDRRHAAAALVVLAASALALWGGFAVLAVLGPFLLAAWLLVRTDRAGFEAVVLVAGFGLLLSMEFVHAQVYPFDRIRWNTTLKVAVQGWTLAAVGAGAVGALLVGRAKDALLAVRRQAPDEGTQPARWRSARSVAAVVALVLVAGVLVTSLPFGTIVFAGEVGEHVADGEVTAPDTLASHDRWKESEMEAIYWLDAQADPTITEAPARRAYQWRNVASVFTDARSVAGWEHQVGYRGEQAYDRRATAVEAVYTGPPANVTAVLERYDVEFIYVGVGERETFDGINAFGTYPGIEVAFRNRAVTIYAVDHDRLDEPSEASAGVDASTGDRIPADALGDLDGDVGIFETDRTFDGVEDGE